MSELPPDDRSSDSLENVEYSPRVLLFLRSKLDDFAIEVFKSVARENRDHRGLLKTRLTDYSKKRFIYERAFSALEAQGFIEVKKDGLRTPYYLTERGKQLLHLVIQEQKK